MADSNIIYSPKFGPLDFSNDVWVRRYRSGDESSRSQTYAIAMNFGGKEYAFIPEDRIQKGWYADGKYNYSPAFLNENTIELLPGIPFPSLHKLNLFLEGLLRFFP